MTLSPLILCLTIEASNNNSLVIRKYGPVSVKSSSSVELSSLYWQIEVSAVVTTRFETLVLGKGALCLLQSHGEVIFFSLFALPNVE